MKCLFSIVTVVFFVSTSLSANTLAPKADTFNPGDKSKIASIQVPFVKNVGQASADVVFYANTFAGTQVVKDTGELLLVLPSKNSEHHQSSR